MLPTMNKQGQGREIMAISELGFALDFAISLVPCPCVVGCMAFHWRVVVLISYCCHKTP